MTQHVSGRYLSTCTQACARLESSRFDSLTYRMLEKVSTYLVRGRGRVRVRV